MNNSHSLWLSCAAMRVAVLLVLLGFAVEGKEMKNATISEEDASQTTNPVSPNQIFILAGQSNMAGRGRGNVPPACEPDPARILRLSAQLQWEVAREPLHHDIDVGKPCGVGPGMSFANAVKWHLDGVLGLVPCAVGGTAIKDWVKGKQLYDNMVKRAKVAAASGGQIKAVLWYQGESDASSQQNVDGYKENLENLIHNVRADLNMPSLPFIEVAIASGEDARFIDKIREIQKGIKIPNVVCADAKGLEIQRDKLHLTTEAQVHMGHRLAEAYLTHFAQSV